MLVLCFKNTGNKNYFQYFVINIIELDYGGIILRLWWDLANLESNMATLARNVDILLMQQSTCMWHKIIRPFRNTKIIISFKLIS